MGFVWAETPLVPDVTKVASSHIIELHTNIDTDRGSVGLGNYLWTKNPTPNKTHVASNYYQEMITALDEAYDANICSTHNNAANTGAQALHDTGAEASHYDAYNLNEHGTYNNANEKSDKSNDNASHQTSHDAAYKAVHYVTYNAVFDGLYVAADVKKN